MSANTQSLDVVEPGGEWVAEPAARPVEHHATEPVEAGNQWSPTRTTVGGPVHEHHRRTPAHLLDPDRDARTAEMHPLLGRCHPDRLPQPLLGLPIAAFVHGRRGAPSSSIDMSTRAASDRTAVPSVALTVAPPVTCVSCRHHGGAQR